MSGTFLVDTAGHLVDRGQSCCSILQCTRQPLMTENNGAKNSTMPKHIQENTSMTRQPGDISGGSGL
jgi:hypothetical protein